MEIRELINDEDIFDKVRTVIYDYHRLPLKTWPEILLDIYGHIREGKQDVWDDLVTLLNRLQNERSNYMRRKDVPGIDIPSDLFFFLFPFSS